MTDTTPILAKLLRTARTQRGYSREQLATATRVPLAFITAIETEDNAALPQVVFCHGFLRIIAKHLHLETAPLLAAYTELHPTPAASRPLLSTNDVLSGQRKTTVRPRRKNLLLTTLAIVLLGGVAFYFLHWRTSNLPETPAHTTLADNEPLVTTTAAPTRPAAATPVPAPVRQQLRLQVILPLHVEIAIDGAKRERRMLLPQSYEFEFEQQAQLTIADTTAVKLWFNGEALGNLARGGRHRVLVFTAAASTTARAEENADHHFRH